MKMLQLLSPETLYNHGTSDCFVVGSEQDGFLQAFRAEGPWSESQGKGSVPTWVSVSPLLLALVVHICHSEGVI